MTDAADRATTDDRLYAKSEPPVLFDHHAQAAAEATVGALDSPAVTRALAPLDISRHRLRMLARLAGRLHDTGKAHPDWQAGCRHAINSDDANRGSVPPHSARSALIAHVLTKPSASIPDLDEPLDPVERAAIIVAILHHHTPLSRKNQSPDGGLVAPTDVDELLEILGNTTTFGDWTMPTDTEGSVRNFRKLIERVRSLSNGSDQRHRIASLTTMLRSGLIQADHHVSSAVDEGPSAPLPASLTESALTFYDDFRPFQQAIADRVAGSTPPTRLCGLADCGAGKTQTALQWGVAQCRAGTADRLVIAMPTRTTSNNLFQTITSDHADPSDVALYHSTSERVYTDALDNERKLATINEYPRHCKWFQQPITICTVDHLLATLVNNDEHSDIARGNLRRAAVVFDEIHAYDRQLLQKITGAIDYLSDEDIPWYVMTATCPPALEDALDPAATVRDPRDEHTPYRVEHHDDKLTAEVVADDFGEGGAQTAMVVKNTVRGAQRLAKRLDQRTSSKVAITYYSSEFPAYDRRAKEREVREQFAPGDVPTDERRILVCTQVCELSLDISVDTLYTDLAPIDAVMQRAGRLHRHGRRATSRRCDCPDCADRERPLPYVCHTYFDPTASTWYPYTEGQNTPEWDLLLATRDALASATTYSFENAQDWIADAYAAYKLRLLETVFRQRITADSLFGPARWDGERIEFRSQTHRRLPVAAVQYDLHDMAMSISFHDLWESVEGHECHSDGEGHCLDGDYYTSCHEALDEAIEEYAIKIPAYWLSDSDIPCNSQSALPEGSHTWLQQVNLSYTYQTGIQNPVTGL